MEEISFDVACQIQRYMKYQPSNMFICKCWYKAIQEYGPGKRGSYCEKTTRNPSIHYISLTNITNRGTALLFTKKINSYQVNCDSLIMDNPLPLMCYINSKLREQKIVVKFSKYEGLNKELALRDILKAFGPFVKRFKLSNFEYTWNTITFTML